MPTVGIIVSATKAKTTLSSIKKICALIALNIVIDDMREGLLEKKEAESIADTYTNYGQNKE